MSTHTPLKLFEYATYTKIDDLLIVEYGEKIYVPINDVAKKIWPNEPHKNAIRTKAHDAHQSGKLYRLPPQTDRIYVPIKDIAQYLRDYCHEDPKARQQLEEYDFDIFEITILRGLDEAYERQIIDLQRQIENKKRKREQILSDDLVVKKTKIDFYELQNKEVLDK
jgi:hypothetical protein